MATLSAASDDTRCVKLLRWHETPETHDIRLVMTPIASEGSLCNKLQIQFAHPEESQIGKYFPGEALRDLTQGLSQIHTHSVRHKDINTQNILVHQGRAMYTEFGISLYFDPHLSATGASAFDNPTGSTLYENTYAAPEILDGFPMSTKSDVFSLACVIWEILVARSVLVLRSKRYEAETVFAGEWGFDRGDGYARRLRDGHLLRAFREVRSERKMQEYVRILDVLERMMMDISKRQVISFSGIQIGNELGSISNFIEHIVRRGSRKNQ